MSIFASPSSHLLQHQHPRQQAAPTSANPPTSSSASVANTTNSTASISASSTLSAASPVPSPTLSDSSVSSCPSVSSAALPNQSLKHQHSFARNQSRHFDTFASSTAPSSSNALEHPSGTHTSSAFFNNEDQSSPVANYNQMNQHRPPQPLPQQPHQMQGASPWGNQKAQWPDFQSFPQGPLGQVQGQVMQQPPSEQNRFKQQSQMFPQYPSPAVEEELIPTAIVIKNIPFAIKKEQLLEVLTSLGLPIPYAFNYHFDNGVFRGLAFANFTTPEETSAVITNLNGREIGGRKLRVEYKKMLPLVERERIEREKRERRGQLEEQHRATSKVRQQQIPQALQQQQHPQQHQQSQQQQHQQYQQHQQQQQINVHGAFAPMSPVQSATNKVDLNDPQTLEFYNKILLFADDKTRSELFFPSTLTVSKKRILMALCTQFGVYFSASDKGVFVTKQPQHAFEQTSTPSTNTIQNSFAQPQPMFHSHQNLAHPQKGQHQQQQQYTSNHVLRGTKSFADIRNPGYSSPGTPTVSPFFPSQTPPPQHHQGNLPPLSLSLQQQRGYQYFSAQQSTPSQQAAPPQRDIYSQYGNAFGPGSGMSGNGVSAMTDSFSSLLNLGSANTNGSLSRVPSTSNLAGSASVGGSPTTSISSIPISTGALDVHSLNNAGVIGSKLSFNNTGGDATTTDNF